MDVVVVAGTVSGDLDDGPARLAGVEISSRSQRRILVQKSKVRPPSA
jgi:hypothetical protein